MEKLQWLLDSVSALAWGLIPAVLFWLGKQTYTGLRYEVQAVDIGEGEPVMRLTVSNDAKSLLQIASVRVIAPWTREAAGLVSVRKNGTAQRTHGEPMPPGRCVSLRVDQEVRSGDSCEVDLLLSTWKSPLFVALISARRPGLVAVWAPMPVIYYGWQLSRMRAGPKADFGSALV
jgi:hypothetical protein